MATEIVIFWRILRWLVLLILLVCIPAMPRFVLGATGGHVRLPLPGTKAISRLAMEIDTHWVSGTGYRPVTVRLIPLGGPAPADRLVTVRLKAGRWNDPTAVSQTIAIPEGSLGETRVIAIPWVGGAPDWIEVEVSEAGRVLEDLSPKRGVSVSIGAGQRWNWDQNEVVPAILFIDVDTPPQAKWPLAGSVIVSSGATSEPNALPDIRTVASWTAMSDGDVGWSDVGESTVPDGAILLTLMNNASLDMLSPDDLPHRWIDYSAVDLIFVSFGDLETLIKGHPKPWQAIRSWVAVGGTLVVYDLGDGFSRLDSLEKWFELPSTGIGDDRRNAWRRPDSKDFGKRIRGNETFMTDEAGSLITAMQLSGGQMTTVVPGEATAGSGATADKSKKEKSKSKSNPKPPERPPFVVRETGLGLIVAFEAEDPFPGKPVQWKWLFNTIGQNRWKWLRRHGMSAQRENQDFWELLIPGVGSPPVGGFLVLITISLIVIGPVNYFLLRRWRRLYLLLVTVPIGAGVITFAIMTYAIVADGLGVKLRVRSYTALDQTTGRAVSWSRQTYYASLVPSGGLSFPVDSAVYCVSENDHRYGQDDRRRQLHWTDDRQRLVRNYLQPRVPSQFLVMRSGQSNARIEVEDSLDDPTSWRVTNRLETEVHQLLVWDSQGGSEGGTYWSEQITVGEQAVLKQIDPNDAQERLRSIFSTHRPALPEGFDPQQYRSSFGMGGFFGYSSMWWGDDGESPTFATSLFERRLKTAVEISHWGSPRGYLAIVRSSTDVPIGIKAAQQIGSFHVIEGRW